MSGDFQFQHSPKPEPENERNGVRFARFTKGMVLEGTWSVCLIARLPIALVFMFH